MDEILRLIKEYIKCSKKVIVTEGTPGDQFGIYADNTLLMKLYEKPLTSFDQGLKKMIEWIYEK